MFEDVGNVAGKQDGAEDATLWHSRLHWGPAVCPVFVIQDDSRPVFVIKDNSLLGFVKVRPRPAKGASDVRQVMLKEWQS